MICPFSQVQFPGITGGNLMYVEEKLFRKRREHQHVGDSDQLTHDHVVPWENSIILEGNKIFTLTGLRPSTEYRLRWLAPDRQYADIMVTTRGECRGCEIIREAKGCVNPLRKSHETHRPRGELMSLHEFLNT